MTAWKIFQKYTSKVPKQSFRTLTRAAAKFLLMINLQLLQYHSCSFQCYN